MNPTYNYATVTEALAQLRQKGFVIDFNLEENYISCEHGKFTHEHFDILEVYRYEGDTDPVDEATVYGIQSTSGIKGVLVTGYGISSDKISTDILKKLSF